VKKLAFYELCRIQENDDASGDKSENPDVTDEPRANSGPHREGKKKAVPKTASSPTEEKKTSKLPKNKKAGEPPKLYPFTEKAKRHNSKAILANKKTVPPQSKTPVG